jgi:hypothetical protein
MTRSKTTCRLVASEGAFLSTLGQVLDAIEPLSQPQSGRQRHKVSRPSVSSVVGRGLSVENGEAIRLAKLAEKHSPEQPPAPKQQPPQQRPALSPAALQAQRDEMRRFISAFGPTRAAAYFSAGLNFREAQDRYRADTEEERKVLSVNAGLGKNLADFAMGCKPKELLK